MRNKRLPGGDFKIAPIPLNRWFRFPSMKPVIKAIRVRRSHRSFVPEEDLEDWQVENIVKAALWAPSAMHYEVCNIILVRGKETRKKLSRATPYARMIENASMAVVLVANPEKSDWLIEDCSATAEDILLEAADMGLGACWVQVREIGQELQPEDRVREILNISKDHKVLCMIAVGVPKKEKNPHTEKEMNRDRVHTERF